MGLIKSLQIRVTAIGFNVDSLDLWSYLLESAIYLAILTNKMT